MKAKKVERLEVRADSETLEAFTKACDSVGRSLSSILRDLMAAAIPYIENTCKNGRWYPPRLVPDVPGTPATVNTVVNGHGNRVRATVRKG